MTVRRIRLSASAITKSFALTILALAFAHLVFQSVKYHLGMAGAYGLVRLFDMGVEANLPTFFSSLQLLTVSLVLVVAGLLRRQAGDRYARHWLWLALIFFLLSVDEMAELHEMTIRPMRELAPQLATGLFYWAWVIPAGALVGVVAVSYAGFVFRYLPGYLRWAAVIGAAVFIGGAIGVEMPEARFAEIHGMDNFTYAMYVLAEETMEMAGILIFLSGLLRYTAAEIGAFAVQVVAPAAPAPMAAGFAPAQRPAH